MAADVLARWSGRVWTRAVSLFFQYSKLLDGPTAAILGRDDDAVACQLWKRLIMTLSADIRGVGLSGRGVFKKRLEDDRQSSAGQGGRYLAKKRGTGTEYGEREKKRKKRGRRGEVNTSKE